MIAENAVEAPGHSYRIPEFSNSEGWLAVVSGLATLGIASDQGPNGSGALCLDYDFGKGQGFVVARRELVVDFPDAWEARFLVRSTGPANTLEIKLVDATGASVWRWVRESFESSDWTELVIPSRDFIFAWGPAGGGAVDVTSAIEVAVVAGPGGAGSVDLAEFRVIDQSPGLDACIESSSATSGHEPLLAFDADLATTWRSDATAGPHSLTVKFTAMRDIGGVVVAWDEGARPASFRIDLGTGDGSWMTAYEQADSVPRTSHIFLEPPERADALRVVAMAARDEAGVGVARIDVRPVEWARTRSEFLTNVALRCRRGAWPRYLVREQTYWTPVATPGSGPVGLLNDDGAVEVGEGGFIVEPSLLITRANGRDIAPEESWVTWADIHRSASLEDTLLPIATVGWRTVDPLAESVPIDAANLALETTVVAEDCAADDLLVARYRIRNNAASPAALKLLVAVRAVQVTPPWQAFRKLGGPSPIHRIEWKDGVVHIDDVATIRPLDRPSAFGAARFADGGIAESLVFGTLPKRASVDDAAGIAESVLAFDVELAAGASRDLYVELRRRRRQPGIPMGERAPAVDKSGFSPTARIESAFEEWRNAPERPIAAGPPGAISVLESAATAIAHIVSCREGAALQPGPRRYSRSWIRDGAIMAAALLRSGRPEAARTFIEWYAPFQREDGFVPCCVDRDGVDPLVEHDSHGQLIYAVAEEYRFRGELDVVRRLWPYCEKAAAYIETIRATRCTAEFAGSERRACFGLLPESVSHEGYLAQPVHSYWDDIWALRGLRDAAYLAGELGNDAAAKKWAGAAAELATAITSSVETVMHERNLATVPASVEWADFDPTAIAGAISLVGATDLFPIAALHKTFDQYMTGVRARNAGTIPWVNYSPYEVRIIGALVHLGRRDEASELLHAMLSARRPIPWRQWPEIVWRDMESPGHLGDLPHCWIGAEFVIALRTMFVHERESDGALVVGAGLRSEWLDGLKVKNLPTWYGRLDLKIRRDGNAYRVIVRGAEPPGGFVAALPDGCETRIEVEQ